MKNGINIATRYANKKAGSKSGGGYIDIKINKEIYKAHRIIWAIYYNEYVENEIDHINGNELDNRIVNLRKATRSQNCMNKPLRTDNTTGKTGVCLYKKLEKWSASICVNSKINHIGYFNTFDEAVSARKDAETRYHGEYARK